MKQNASTPEIPFRKWKQVGGIKQFANVAPLVVAQTLAKESREVVPKATGRPFPGNALADGLGSNSIIMFLPEFIKAVHKVRPVPASPELDPSHPHPPLRTTPELDPSSHPHHSRAPHPS